MSGVLSRDALSGGLLSMKWRDLLFAHWPVAPRMVAAGLPEGVAVDTHDGDPGVYFFNLDADDRVGIRIARSVFQLPYYRAEMDVQTSGSGRDREVRFGSRRTSADAPSAAFDATCGPGGSFSAPDPESEAAFLTERYRFYTTDDDGRVYHGGINHEPWSLAAGRAEIRENGLFEANGFEAPAGEPLLQFAAPITVTAGRIRRPSSHDTAY